MEITLEKIELVKDRTGVSYKDAKEALEKTEGNVVDAIILIENNIDETSTASESKATAVVDAVKNLVKKGNVTKILVKKGDDVVLNLPVNVGIVGTVVFPWPALAAAVLAFGTKCTVEIIKEDGEVMDVSAKANEVISVAKSKGGVIVDEVKDKGGDVLEFAKEKGGDAFEFAKEKGKDVFDAAKDAGAGAWDLAKEKASGALKKVKGENGEATDFGDLDLSDVNFNELEDDNE